MSLQQSQTSRPVDPDLIDPVLHSVPVEPELMDPDLVAAELLDPDPIGVVLVDPELMDPNPVGVVLVDPAPADPVLVESVPDPAPVDPADYAALTAVMESFASGVAVITARTPDGEPHGLTCSAVCSVSATPPLLLACLRRPSRTLDLLREHGTFAVNFLDAGARELSQHFSDTTPAGFDGIAWHPGPARGVPVLDGVLAHAECATWQVIETGDDVIVIGLLVGGDVDAGRFPLGYWRGRYMQMYRLDQPR